MDNLETTESQPTMPPSELTIEQRVSNIETNIAQIVTYLKAQNAPPAPTPGAQTSPTPAPAGAQNNAVGMEAVAAIINAIRGSDPQTNPMDEFLKAIGSRTLDILLPRLLPSSKEVRGGFKDAHKSA